MTYTRSHNYISMVVGENGNKHSKLSLCGIVLIVDIWFFFVPISTHSIIFLDKWVVQIYINVTFKVFVECAKCNHMSGDIRTTSKKMFMVLHALISYNCGIFTWMSSKRLLLLLLVNWPQSLLRHLLTLWVRGELALRVSNTLTLWTSETLDLMVALIFIV